MTLWKGAKVNRGRDYVPGFYEIPRIRSE